LFFFIKFSVLMPFSSTALHYSSLAFLPKKDADANKVVQERDGMFRVAWGCSRHWFPGGTRQDTPDRL